MATYSNITPTAIIDGVVYANNVPVTTTEAALGDAVNSPAAIPVIEGQEILAIVKLNTNGFVVANNTYIVMQTDFGDGTWIDVAWIVWNQVQGTATFVMSAGGRGLMNNAFQQSRQSNSAPTPQANGSNACPLGGRVRFTGKATVGGGSSFAAGATNSVTATITYKLTTPR